MFGLKKEKELFEFDLEKDLKAKPEKKQQLLEGTKNKIGEIKTLLRSGTDTKDFDQYGVLLHGYDALLKIANRIGIKK